MLEGPPLETPRGMFKREVESGCAFSPDACARDRKGTEELRGLEPALLCESAVWLALCIFLY